MEMNQSPVSMVDTTENETTVLQLQARISTLEKELEELRRWKEKNETDHTTPLSTHRFHTIQFHPSRPLAFIERLPGSVLIHSVGPFLTGDEMLKLGFSSGRIMNSLHPDFSTAPYHYPSESIGSNEIWCLEITKRSQDHYNSTVRTSCRYFRTKEEAERAEIDEGRDFMEYEYEPDNDRLIHYPLEVDENTPLADKYAAWDTRILEWGCNEYAPFGCYISQIQIEQLRMNEVKTTGP